MKVGIIGTGFMATSHIEALNRLKNVEVVAIASIHSNRAKKLSEIYHIAKSYRNFYELIDDPEVEAIHNCTPNNSHFDVIKYALENNKHIISEKPLALNSEESGILTELAAKSSAIAGVCFNYRFFPMVQQIKAMVSNQLDGIPLMVRGGYIQDWLLYPTDYNWRIDPDVNGKSRAIADIGSHWCDTIQYILGKKITAVFADLETVHKERVVIQDKDASDHPDKTEKVKISTEDFGNVVIKFEDGLKGAFTVSQITAGRKNNFHFEVSLEDASYYWDQETPNKVWIGKRDEPNRELVKDAALLHKHAAKFAHYPGGHQEGWPDALKNLFIDFYDAIENGNSNNAGFATIEESHHVMKIIDAILESSKKQQWVEIA